MENKKVVFIGGGAASLTSAVLLKKEEPSFDVIIVEKDKKLGKKLSATGGGKCNIAPLMDNPYSYNFQAIEMLEKLYKDIPLDHYLCRPQKHTHLFLLAFCFCFFNDTQPS